MRPPRSIRLGPRTYDVHVAPAAAEQLVDSPGSSDSHKRRIDLLGSTVPDHLRETLFHEVLHQVLDLAGLTAAHAAAPPEVADELEERIVTRSAPLLLAVLRDNPTLVKFLVEST